MDLLLLLFFLLGHLQFRKVNEVLALDLLLSATDLVYVEGCLMMYLSYLEASVFLALAKKNYSFNL